MVSPQMPKADDQEERAALQKLMTLLLRHTVVLVRTDAPGRGSGFVIPWNGGVRIVTARHVIEKGEWAVEALDSSRGTDAPPLTERDVWNIPLADRETLRLRLRPDPASLNAVKDDIAWAWFDVDRDALAADPKAKSWSVPQYSGPLDAVATDGEVYAFAAANRDEVHDVARAVVREVSWEAYMTLTALDANGLILGLARDHQGHAFYRGASGAPVADRTGTIVGVLVGPGNGANELRAASLERFIRAMRQSEARS